MNRCACGNSINHDGTVCLQCIALQELGLKSGATDANVREAYLLYVKAWHPYRFPGDEKSKSAAQEKLEAINFAYGYLNYLSANAQNFYSKSAPAPTNTQEPVQRSQTTAGKPPQAQQPSPMSNISSHSSPKSAWSNTLFSKFPATRHWGYLFYLIPVILLALGWVLGKFNTTPPNRGSSPATSTEATSHAVPRPPGGLTPVPIDEKDIGLPTVRLLNGTELRKRRHVNGLGGLTVENGTGYDAAILLVELNTEKTIRNFYVTAGSSFTEPRIAPGVYAIYFVTGSDWNPELTAFNFNANYSHFGRNVEFSEKPDQASGKIEYSTYKITLQPVVGGNAAINPSDKDASNKLMNDASTD